MTGGELILRFLVGQDVRLGFGIPGALNAHLYDALPRVPAFRHVLVRHELGGGWMADGYARTRNEVGVLFTVPGPGATHAASAVAGAYTDCSRLLVISASSESGLRGELRRDLFHGLDQQRLFAPVTAWTAAVRSARDLPEALAEAFRRLRSGRPGPVQVEVPSDVLGQETAAPEEWEYLPGAPPAPRPTALQAAAAEIRRARMPLFMAGDGVLHADAGGRLAALATALRCPVVTSGPGKAALTDDSPWCLGDGNSVRGAAVYPHHDLLVAVGERFTQVDTRWPWFFPPRRLVHLDADPRELGRLFPPAVAVPGEVGGAVDGLAALLVGDPPAGPYGWEPVLEEIRALPQPVSPLLAALRGALPDEAVLSCDVCLPGYLSRWEWPVRSVRSWLYPQVYVGMGFGLPAGIGAALAAPGRPVCVLAGDGGFQMTMAELGTLMQERLPVVVLVVNDGGLTLIRRVQDRDFGGRRVEVDLRNPDFRDLARAYGMPAERVEDPEAAGVAVERAVAAGGPALVELRC